MKETFDYRQELPQYMDSKDASQYLRIPIRKLNLYRSEGLIKSIRCGKGYCYRREWLDQFMENFAGYDISNRTKIRAAINEQKWRKSHE